jgi:mono/diheme cytochrome c family protein
MITNGSGQMPAFKNTLSAEQIREVMAYSRGFRQ